MVHFGAVVSDAPSPSSTPRSQFWLYSRQLRAPTKLAHTHLFAHLLSRSTPELARSRIRSSNRTGDVPPRTNHRVETDRTGDKQRTFTWTVHVATPTRSGTSTATSRQTTRPTSPRRSRRNRDFLSLMNAPLLYSSYRSPAPCPAHIARRHTMRAILLLLAATAPTQAQRYDPAAQRYQEEVRPRPSHAWPAGPA